ncbi:MAG: hypothetical protein GYB65_21650, partial [Chloroflexi bacterium]|nr:hypothetical protein [Chloroflexota bacterium]
MSSDKRTTWFAALPLVLLIALALACSLTSVEDEEPTDVPTVTDETEAGTGEDTDGTPETATPPDDGQPATTPGSPPAPDEADTAVALASVPQATIDAPENNALVLVNSTVDIFVSATDPVGVTRVELLVDDMVVDAQSASNPATGDTELRALMNWQPFALGSHQITVLPWRGDLAGDPVSITLSVVERFQPTPSLTIAPDIGELLAQTETIAALELAGPIPSATASVTPSPLPTIDRTCRAQVTVGTVSLRAGPGGVYPPVGSATIGEEFPVLGRQLFPAQWAQVNFGGQYAWISEDYANLLGDCSGIGIVLPPPTPAPADNTIVPTLPPTPTPLPPTPFQSTAGLSVGVSAPTVTAQPCRAIIDVENLTVYSGPGTGYMAMTFVVQGQQFDVVGIDPSEDWQQIALAGTFGWIQDDFTVTQGVCGDVGEVPVPPTPTPTPSITPTIVPSNTPVPPTPTFTPSQTPVPPTSTFTQTPSQTPAPPTPTNTQSQTPTPLPPTDTLTPEPPTDTPTPVTPTLTPTPVPPTDTPTPITPTLTPVPPTDTPTPVPPTETRTPTPLPNNPPAIEAPEDQALLPGEVIELPYTVADPDGDPVTVVAQTSDDSIATARVISLDTLQLATLRAGRVTITLVAEDGRSARADASFTVAINTPPTITAPQDQVLVPGDEVELPYTASDQDGDPVTVVAQSSDPALATVRILDADTVQVNTLRAGTVTITLVVEDSRGVQAEGSFRVTINSPPTITAPEDQTLVPGSSLELLYDAADPDGDSLEVTIQSSDDSIAAATILDEENLQLDTRNGGTATITLAAEDDQGARTEAGFVVVVNTPPTIEPVEDLGLMPGEIVELPYVAADADGDPLIILAESSDETIAISSVLDPDTLQLNALRAGTVTITLTANDGSTDTAQTTFEVAVNTPPDIAPIPDQVLIEGDTLELTYSGTDADGDQLVTVAVVDDPNIATAEVFPPNTLRLTANVPGTTTVTLRAADSRDGIGEITFAVEVEERNITPEISLPADSVTLVAGDTASATIDATDPNGDPLTIEATSADPSVASAEITDTTLTLTANTAGTTTVTIAASDGRGGEAQFVVTVTVEEPNYDPAFETIAEQQVVEGETIPVPYTVTDPNGDLPTVIAQAEDSSVASAAVEPGNITVTGLAPGSTTIIVRADDGRGGVAEARFLVQVEQRNRPPTLAPVAPQTVVAGEFLDVPYSASDPDEDLLSVIAESDNTGIVTAAITSPNTLRLTGQAEGFANVTLRADDGRGGTAEIRIAVTVEAPNTPPTVQSIPPQTLQANDTLPVQVNVSDPDPIDLVTLTASAAPPNVVEIAIAGTTLNLRGLNPGTVTVIVTATDSRGLAAETSFTVEVTAANNPPAIDQVPGQTVTAGTTQQVPFTAGDPDGDLLTVVATSDSPVVVTAAVIGPNQLELRALAPGTAYVTVRADDGRGAVVEMTFQVSVVANNPPYIDPIPNQSLEPGQRIDLPLGYGDPENEEVAVNVVSGNPNVAVVQYAPPNTVSIMAQAAGTATITVTVADSANSPVSASFTVSVVAPNTPPTVAPIAPQTVPAGESISVQVMVSDGDGDDLTISADSANPGVVTASVVPPSTVTINGVSAGPATITVTVTDNVNLPVSVSFTVEVTAANAPPEIGPIPDQVFQPGDSFELPFPVADPEGDPLTIDAVSDNPAVATVSVSSQNSITINALAAGTATITVSASDNVNLPVSTAFGVYVEAQDIPEPPPVPPGVDLAELPFITPITGPVYDTVLTVFQTGRNLPAPTNPGIFSIVGDAPPTDFLGSLAEGEPNFGPLEDAATLTELVFAYRSTPLPIDNASNSFAAGGLLSTGDGWTSRDVLDPAQANASLCQPGETPLGCELRTNRPAVIFISVGRSDAQLGISPDEFRANLEQIVTISAVEYGAIPLLFTIPGDPTQVGGYNAEIVAV